MSAHGAALHFGYPSGKTFAVVAGLSELLGGLGLAVGFLTPIAVAALVGRMANAISVKWHGLFLIPNGTECELVPAAGATALALTGPGRLVADRHVPGVRDHRIGFGGLSVAFGLLIAVGGGGGGPGPPPPHPGGIFPLSAARGRRFHTIRHQTEGRSMRALIMTRPGEANGFTLELLRDPRPAHGQIRIKMAGAAVNPVDLHVLDIWARGTVGAVPGRLPGLGMDVAGVVDMVGPAVRGFLPGTPVAALHFPHAPNTVAGAAAEYVVVPAAHAAPIPPGVELVDAATVPLNSLTAAQLLAPLGPAEGRRLLVTGAAGGVGGYAVGLAAHTGWAVTGLARAFDADFLSRAGAVDMITSPADARGFDAVLDAALLNGAALRAVRDHGTYVGVYPGAEPEVERGITITTGVVTPDGGQLRTILELTAQGVLEARRAGNVPLHQAARAYQSLRSGGQRGRWVLTP